MDRMIDWRYEVKGFFIILVDLLMDKEREKSIFFISKIFSHLLTSWVNDINPFSADPFATNCLWVGKGLMVYFHVQIFLHSYCFGLTIQQLQEVLGSFHIKVHVGKSYLRHMEKIIVQFYHPLKILLAPLLVYVGSHPLSFFSLNSIVIRSPDRLIKCKCNIFILRSNCLGTKDHILI